MIAKLKAAYRRWLCRRGRHWRYPIHVESGWGYDKVMWKCGHAGCTATGCFTSIDERHA